MRRLLFIAGALGLAAVAVAAPPDDSIFDLDSMPKAVDRQPRPTLQGHPQYPFELRQAGTEGFALIDFIVAPSGTTKNCQVVLSTDPQFSEEALRAVGGWLFEPGMRNGHPVNVHMQVPIIFALDPASTAAGDASAETQKLYAQLLKCWAALETPGLRARIIHLQVHWPAGAPVSCSSSVEPANAANADVIATALETVAATYEYSPEAQALLQTTGILEFNLEKWQR